MYADGCACVCRVKHRDRSASSDAERQHTFMAGRNKRLSSASAASDKELSAAESKPVLIRPGSRISVDSGGSASGRPRAESRVSAARASAGEEKQDAAEGMPEADAVDRDTEAKVLARVSEFSGKLLPEELEKLSETGQACAKAGAKAGAEAGATAGM
jgi:hypothetical protein